MDMFKVRVYLSDGNQLYFKFVNEIQISDGFLIIAYITPNKHAQVRYINKDIVDNFSVEEM